MDRDLAFVLVCAVRYALGRRSYAPMVVAGVVRREMARLPDETLRMIADDIASKHQRFGLDDWCDKDGWLRVRDDIRAEIARREGGADADR